MRSDLVKLGMTIKRIRKEKKMTIKELALKAGISIGLVSKIENFRTVPSLPVLASIARGLEESLSELVKDICPDRDRAFILVRKNERENVEREEGKGIRYEKLVAEDVSAVHFQSFLLTLQKGAKRRKASTDGDEFLFMIKGAITFKLGKDNIELEEGDSIYFDGSIPHVPLNNGDGEAVFLVVYLIK